MKISIITVCYNSGDTIKDTILSVIGQTYKNIEYIIIDGGSTDATLNIINQFKQNISTIISEPDNGIYDAMNKGIELSTGDVVGILNSDDFFENTNVVENIANNFKETPFLDAVFGDVILSKPNSLNKISRYYSSRNFQPWMLNVGVMPAHPASFIKKSIYEDIGCYRTDLEIAADFEFMVRFFLKNSFFYLKTNMPYVRMRSGGVSNSGFNSFVTVSKEIKKSFLINSMNASMLFICLRLPIKFFQLFKKI